MTEVGSKTDSEDHLRDRPQYGQKFQRNFRRGNFREGNFQGRNRKVSGTAADLTVIEIGQGIQFSGYLRKK